jgi:hypothetical protein
MNLYCLKCEKIYVDTEFSYATPEESVCPDCNSPAVLPEVCCGLCANSSELGDGTLICCPRSSQKVLNTVPYNAESSQCKLYQPFYEEDIGSEEDEGIDEDDLEESEEEEENEFSDILETLE